MKNELQVKYYKWQEMGLDLAHQFTAECTRLITEILNAYHDDCDPEVRGPSEIPIVDHDTFTSAWIDEQGNACCAAMIEDGSPMGWRVEFLDLHLKRELHEVLLGMYDELQAEGANE